MSQNITSIRTNDILPWRNYSDTIIRGYNKKFEKRNLLSDSMELDVNDIIKSKKSMKFKIDPNRIIKYKYKTIVDLHNEFSSEEIIQQPSVSDTFIISNKVFEGIKQAIIKAKNKYESLDDIYIACPTYWKGNKIVDTQICVTGKCHVDESSRDAVIREMSEELGFYTPSNKLEYVIDIKTDTDIYDTYIVDVQYIEPYNNTKHTFSVKEDDRTKKCQVIISGTKNDFIKIIENIRQRYANDENTINEIKNIRSITLLPLVWFI